MADKFIPNKVTEEMIDAQIMGKDFYVFPGTTVTVCALKLRNGFVVTGTSACASPEVFEYAIGERLAFEKARDKVWELEGYLLRSRLAGRVA